MKAEVILSIIYEKSLKTMTKTSGRRILTKGRIACRVTSED